MGVLNQRTTAHQQAAESLARERKEWDRQRVQFEQLDSLLRQRPDVQQYVQQLLGQEPPATAVQQRTQADLDDLRAELKKEFEPALAYYQRQKADAEWEQMLGEVFADRQVLPQGTDEAAVRHTLDAIANSADPSREMAIVVARYHARAAGAAAGAERNGRGRLPSGGTTPPTEPFAKKGDTNAAIEKKMLAAIGAGG